MTAIQDLTMIEHEAVDKDMEKMAGADMEVAAQNHNSSNTTASSRALDGTQCGSMNAKNKQKKDDMSSRQAECLLLHAQSWSGLVWLSFLPK